MVIPHRTTGDGKFVRGDCVWLLLFVLVFYLATRHVQVLTSHYQIFADFDVLINDVNSDNLDADENLTLASFVIAGGTTDIVFVLGTSAGISEDGS